MRTGIIEIFGRFIGYSLSSGVLFHGVSLNKKLQSWFVSGGKFTHSDRPVRKTHDRVLRKAQDEANISAA
jgi:hypothetical protein